MACRKTLSTNDYIFPDITKVPVTDTGEFVNVFSQEYILDILKSDHSIHIIDNDDMPYDYAQLSTDTPKVEVKLDEPLPDINVTTNHVESELFNQPQPEHDTDHQQFEHNN